jgi:hypothetical protein
MKLLNPGFAVLGVFVLGFALLVYGFCVGANLPASIGWTMIGIVLALGVVSNWCSGVLKTHSGFSRGIWRRDKDPVGFYRELILLLACTIAWIVFGIAAMLGYGGVRSSHSDGVDLQNADTQDSPSARDE